MKSSTIPRGRCKLHSRSYCNCDPAIYSICDDFVAVLDKTFAGRLSAVSVTTK
jgi:hypothetical protein